MALPIGTTLDTEKYKLKVVQVLGEGGMGTVYKVEQFGTSLGVAPYYAVKELLIPSKEERETAIERFNKEIAILRRLKHPRIAEFSGSFQWNGKYYFAMEFVPGHTLEKVLEDAKGPLPEDQVLGWMMQVCEALSYIHTLNPPIILRDLKPGNIMVTAKHDVKLIDFGIARRYDPNKRTNTENLGTISYASPEHLGSITAPGQRRSAQNPGRLVQTDARSDIYSLGATMYHLLTNYEPDPIQTPPTRSVLAKNKRLHAAVEQVIIKAMQQSPALRFQSAEEMRIALQQCLPNRGVPATVQIPAMSPHATIIVRANGNAPALSAGSVGLICPKCGFRNRPGAKFCTRDREPLVKGVGIAPPQHSFTTTRPGLQAAPATFQIPAMSPNATITVHANGSMPAPPASSTQEVFCPKCGFQNRPGAKFCTRDREPLVPGVATTSPQSPIMARPSAPVRSVPPPQPIRARPVQTPANKVPARPQPIRARPVQSIQARPVGVNNSENGAQAAFGEGRQLLIHQKFSEAIERFKQAQSLGNASPDLLYNLGSAYRQYARSVRESDKKLFSQNMALATQTLEEALKINPNHVLILIELGQVYIEMKQIALAIKRLRTATQRDPAIWEGWYHLGRAHMKQQKWAYALSALERARQINAGVSAIYTAMATCFLKQSNKVEARRMINEALQLNPQNPEVIRLQKQL